MVRYLDGLGHVIGWIIQLSASQKCVGYFVFEFVLNFLIFQEQHAYDYHRLALVRYEMLALTSPQFTLQDMVPNREFLVPTQLHDLFCWIHDHDPLDLLGN